MARLSLCTVIPVLPHPLGFRHNFQNRGTIHKDALSQYLHPRMSKGGIVHPTKWQIAVDAPAIYHRSPTVGVH